MSLDSIVQYCTQTDVENYLSVLGVKSRLDDDGDGYVSDREQQRMTDAINDATETINFYCWDKYLPASLATSNAVNRWTTKLAAYVLCSGRANPVPDQLVEDCSKAEEKLQKIHDGGYKLPGTPLRHILAPVWSQTRVDPRFNFRCIRVERNNSSQHNPTTLRQNTDWQEAYTFEI